MLVVKRLWFLSAYFLLSAYFAVGFIVYLLSALHVIAFIIMTLPIVINGIPIKRMFAVKRSFSCWLKL